MTRGLWGELLLDKQEGCREDLAESNIMSRVSVAVVKGRSHTLSGRLEVLGSDTYAAAGSR